MRFRKFLKPYKTRGSSFREHTVKKEGDSIELLILLESTKKRLNDSWKEIYQ